MTEVPKGSSFISRAKIAATEIDSINRIPTIAEPSYLTDLGVRRFADPEKIYKENISRLGLTELHVPESSERFLASVPLSAFASEIDKYLLFIGDYESCARVIEIRRDEIVSSGDYELLVYSGTIEGALAFGTAIEFFQAAYESTHLAENKFMALHRKAIVQLKRLRDFDSAENSLDLLVKEIHQSFSAGLISEGDMLGFEDMANNARALVYVVRNKMDVARSFLPKKHHIRPRRDLLILDFDQACRYQAQENINLAQLFLSKNYNADAISILKDNTVFCSLWAENYLSESLSILAYALFLNKEFQLSLILSLQSAKLIEKESSPTRLRKNQEVIVGSIHQLGFVDEARLVWEKFNERVAT
jgi:hypothetical protein